METNVLDEIKTKIGDEAYAKLTEYVGDKELHVAPKGTLFPKQRVDDIIKERDANKSKADTLQTRVSELEAKGTGLETLQNKVTELETALKAKDAETEQKIGQIKLDYAFDDFLKGKGAKDAKIVSALFDKTKLTFDGEKLGGAEEQYAAIFKGHEYLFGEIKPTIPPSAGGPKPDPFAGKTQEEINKALRKL